MGQWGHPLMRGTIYEEAGGGSVLERVVILRRSYRGGGPTEGAVLQSHMLLCYNSIKYLYMLNVKRKTRLHSIQATV